MRLEGGRGSGVNDGQLAIGADHRYTLDRTGVELVLWMERTVAATIDIGTLITRTPGIRGGRPRIAGTGVSVQRIVIWYKMGHIPEEITMHIPHLTLAQVYAALAYYHANRDEIEADIAAEETEATRLEQEHLATRSPA
jgi:uncharacterized protein (DUF433 family)